MADDDLVTDGQLALADGGTVDLRRGLIAEIDQRDVLRIAHLNDRMHPRSKFVLDLKMALRILANLDDVLADRLSTGQRISLIESERENCFCHDDLEELEKPTRSVGYFSE